MQEGGIKTKDRIVIEDGLLLLEGFKPFLSSIDQM